MGQNLSGWKYKFGSHIITESSNSNGVKVPPHVVHKIGGIATVTPAEVKLKLITLIQTPMALPDWHILPPYPSTHLQVNDPGLF